MRRLLKFLLILVVTGGMCSFVQAGVIEDLVAGGGEYRAYETKTGTAHSVVPVTLTGRRYNARVLCRVTQIADDANNTATVYINSSGGYTFKALALPATTATNTSVTADFGSQSVLQDGVYSSASNLYPVVIGEGDSVAIYGTTNAVVTYRLEYVDLRQ